MKASYRQEHEEGLSQKYSSSSDMQRTLHYTLPCLYDPTDSTDCDREVQGSAMLATTIYLMYCYVNRITRDSI